MQTLKSETKSWGFIKLVILSLAVFNFTALGQIQTYNIVAGFSDQSNPAGVWSYGKTSAGAATFDIFTTQMTGAWAEGCFLFRGSTVCAHAVSYDDGTRILNWGNIGEPVIRLGKFSGYPDLTVLRFTAPNAGDYTIRITARSSRGEDMMIRTNGQTAYATGGMIIHYTNSMSLAVGDTIDFVGSSYNGSSDYPMNGVYLSGSVTLDSGTGLPGVTFIPAGGLFTNSLSVVMQNNLASGVIRFTTNATNPTASSTVYPGPIRITSATEFRATVFDNATAISPVYTASYARVYAVNDGIPAAWREQHFGPGYLTDPRVAADADPDGDQVDNLHEYWAGTDPLNASSVKFIYYVERDFSADHNPAGPWSYGYKSTSASFTLYPTNYGGSWGIFEYYSGGPASGIYQFGAAAFALRNNSGNPALGITWRPTLFPTPPPGNDTEEPTLRFTSPGSGNCAIQLFGYVDYGDVEFRITVNGELISKQPVFQSMTVSNTATVSVSSGSTIDFSGRITSRAVPMDTTLYLSGYITFESTNAPALIYVPAGGLFTNSLDVHLVNNLTNGVIRLTLDGTNPSAVSPAYTSPVTITNATEFRAAVFAGNTPISQVYTTSFARVYAIDDGIPASWRQQYFGPGYLTDPRVAADADPDGDLATNREEYLAGTNPLDNTSGFKATVAAVPLIRFGSESNRVYRILRSDDLSTNRTVVATLTATNSVTSYVDASVYPNKGFYVIELLP